MTIRILDQENGGIRLEKLGLSEIGSDHFVDALARPQGIVLVTGPTGSGKSSTLYACLNSLNSPTVNVITVEDPVEFDIAGINQVQIHPQAGITFATGLRSILRQDPDIVMVGEIRDSETASIAFQAGQTGHLVLSTLHTNDAPSAVIRLLDLSIPAFLISTSLITVVGQRLVRRVCPKCKELDPLTPHILKQIPMYLDEVPEKTFWKGIGCEACHYTGYSGRLGIFEVLMITPSLKEIIEPGVTTLALRKAAKAEGFRSMASDGIHKALQGLTTIEEVYRVAPPEDRETSQRQLMDAFDLEETPNQAHQPQMPLASVSGITHKKILVVDDNALTLRLLRNSLEAENYLVITARSVSEAMKVVFQEKPDLIITDYVTQETAGITLIKKLRSQLSTRFLPIIMLTVKDNLNYEVKGIAAGADDYVRKPVNLKSLLIRVKRLLERQPYKNA